MSIRAPKVNGAVGLRIADCDEWTADSRFVIVSSMRAAHLIEPGRIDIREVPDPAPEPGEIVVRVERALTCGTDLKAFRRGHPFIPMPGPFGHQYTGVVAAVGAGVRGREEEMPLWGVHSAPCGECRSCATGRFNLCLRLDEDMAIGAFTQLLRIPRRVVSRNVMPRPSGMAPERAAFLEPVSCVVHALELIDWRSVDRVLVLGLGAMGLLFTRLLPLCTRASVVGAGRNEKRLALARGRGLERVIDAGAAPLADQLADDPGFDCVIECTGREGGWRAGFEAVRPGGQVLFFGGLPRGTTFGVDTFKLHYEEARLLGCFHFTPGDVRRAAELLENEAVELDDLLTGELALEELERALLDMESGAAIKYAINPWI
jgi:L-iditol 2-dehydrogenase